MRNITKSLVKSFCVLLVSFLALNPVQAQIFFEDFEGGVLPAGWAVFDGDGQTPHPNVPQFTSAWIVAEDFDIAGDTVAMSTSWYQPLTGPSNDWLMTPGIALTTNNELRWQGEAQDAAYPDGYEVRLTTGAQLPANTTNYSNVLATIAAESGATRTNRVYNLQGGGFSNQTVRIAWRNNSLDMFVLMIDNIEVRSSIANDVEMTSAQDNEYTLLPLAQVTNIPLTGSITNVGTASAASVTMTVNVYNNATLVTSVTSPGQTLAVGATGNFTATPFTPTATGFYVFEYIANLTGDGDHSNDTLYWGLNVTDSTMGRDDGNVNGFLGIGAGNGGILGQVYKLNTAASMTSVGFYFTPDIGQSYVADVYSWNLTTHTPGAVVRSTVPFVSTVDTSIYLEVMLTSPLALNANDTFYVGVREPDSTLALGTSATNWIPGVTFLDWPTNPQGPWSNNEDFGFNRVYVLRPNFNACGNFAAVATGSPTTCGNSTGSATASPTGGTAPYTYAWSNGGTTATISNLAAGIYTVTISSSGGCTSTATFNVINSNGPTVSSTSTPVSCNGAANGIGGVTVTGGAAPYTYLWSNGATTQNVSNLAPGTYTVTVTDAGSCTGFAAVTITQPAALAANANAIDETCQSCNDGTAAAAPSGGTAPYTYLWSNNQTTQVINFLAPGSYTVTVTDANGCTSSQTVTVSPFIVGVDQSASLDVQVYPNPSNGQFSLNVNAPSIDNIKVEIYGTLGQLVWSDAKNATSTYQREFSFNELAAGRYMIKVIVGEQTSIRKLVIE